VARLWRRRFDPAGDECDGVWTHVLVWPTRNTKRVSETNPEDERSAALRAVEQRLLDHPGRREQDLCDGLARTIYAVLIPNRDDLLSLLDRAANDVNLAVELFQNVRRPVVRRRFEGAVMRGLHNYTASAGTLVDHSRRIMRGREGPIVEEFARRKRQVMDNPEVPFVHMLRNYVLHHSLPFIGHEVRIQPRPGVVATSEIKLSVRELTEWDGWTAPARRFIDSHDEALPLRPVVEAHAGLVIELNLWLYEQLVAANASALDDANLLVVERNAVLGGTDIEEARRVTEEWTRRREDPAGEPKARS
jgi:hypothetical protein